MFKGLKVTTIANAQINDKNNISGRQMLNTYEKLNLIYNYLLEQKKIFKDVFAFIQGGYALYLYGYDKIMKKYPLIGTNDIDIHIEPKTKIIESYNKQIQTFFVKLCSKFKNKIDLNNCTPKWYYGTSKYIDITYDPHYISLALYKDYCLNTVGNPYNTEVTYTTHLNSNIDNLLLPIEYVKFNCIHMFVLLLNAFSTKKSNNRVPKTLKILKRIIMIYDFEIYSDIDDTITDLLNKITIIISSNKTKVNKTSQIADIYGILDKLLYGYRTMFVSKPHINTNFLNYLITKLNIQSGGNITKTNNLNNNVGNLYSDYYYSDYYYNDNELESISAHEIMLNKITALIFKNIIINKIDDVETIFTSITKFIKLKNNINTQKHKNILNSTQSHSTLNRKFNNRFNLTKKSHQQILAYGG